MTIDLTQFHQVFYEESFEGLDVMEAALMELDPENIDEETINTIFRSAHSIKGGSATFGFTAIAEFTHDLETILDQVRSRKRHLSGDDVNVCLKSVDCMREMLQSLQAGESGHTVLSEQLKRHFSAMLGTIGTAKIVDDPVDSSAPSLEKSPVTAFNCWRIHFSPSKGVLRSGNDIVRMFRELSALGHLYHVACDTHFPDFRAIDPESCYMGWQLELESRAEKWEIEEIFEWVLDESKLEITEVKAAAFVDEAARNDAEVTGSNPIVDNQKFGISPSQPLLSGSTNPRVISQENEAKLPPVTADSVLASVSPPGKKSTQESGSIRVGIDKVDNLINMVGELVITQSMLGQLGSEFDIDRIPMLMEGLSQLENNTRELQEIVMRIRMLPISFAFSRFPRMVRDLGQSLGKTLHLEMQGEQTELDKTVMEKIGDPLLHLVRNAVDHGIETPEERSAKGKPKQGLITLKAYHQSGNVVIEIADDGRGLDKSRIVKKAIERGIVAEGDAESISEEQAFDLIFQPGFSTAHHVSDVSGRGVGMDVVKRNIELLNGHVEMSSKKDIGSTITIRLPLTLAILDGQLVRVGNNTYIFPLVSIVESLHYQRDFVSRVAGGCDVFKLRDDYVPIIELSKAFSVMPDSVELDQSLLVVVECGSEKIGVVVDELLAQQQVVIKSLEKNYKRVDGISGATILGDGTVALILDINGIVKLAGEKFGLAQSHRVVSGKIADMHRLAGLRSVG